MRVSMAAFVSIKDERGRYALLVNRYGLSTKDKRYYTPIGGVLKATSQGMNYLTERLGAHSFERPGHELRFQVPPETKLKALCDWFFDGTNKDRESNPVREVWEELCEENRILSASHVMSLQFQPIGFGFHIGPSGRAEGESLRVIEIFKATSESCGSEIIAQLKESAQRPKPSVIFASGAEIMKGRTGEGQQIHPITLQLLNPRSAEDIQLQLP